MSAVRRLNVASPSGTHKELCFLPWEKLSDVADRAARLFGVKMRAPRVRLSNGKIPPQDTQLVCFVNGDELTLVDADS
jgi:hypothetical protein